MSGWFFKAALYNAVDEKSKSALVSTNSICQGQQVGILWPLIFENNININFAYTSFHGPI